VRTDAARHLGHGCTWWQVPPVAKWNCTGSCALESPERTSLLRYVGFFTNDEVFEPRCEFSGDGIRYLNVNHRLTIANMSTEWGALAGVFPVDDIVIEWLLRRIEFRRSGRGEPGWHPRPTGMVGTPV